MPEFGSRLIEVLRQPLEGQPREVSISRASGTITFPANFMLIAAQNPCPCGYYGDNSQTCTCSNSMITACKPIWAEAARAFHRILKLARTIADLADEDGNPEGMPIQPAHLAEALQDRPRA